MGYAPFPGQPIYVDVYYIFILILYVLYMYMDETNVNRGNNFFCHLQKNNTFFKMVCALLGILKKE